MSICSCKEFFFYLLLFICTNTKHYIVPSLVEIGSIRRNWQWKQWQWTNRNRKVIVWRNLKLQYTRILAYWMDNPSSSWEEEFGTFFSYKTTVKISVTYCDPHPGPRCLGMNKYEKTLHRDPCMLGAYKLLGQFVFLGSWEKNFQSITYVKQWTPNNLC